MTLSPLQYITFVALAGVLVMLTLTWLAPMPESTPKEWAADVPQWFALTANSMSTDAQGKAKYQVSAVKLSHYEQLQQTQIVKPEAVVFNPDSPPWQLQAEHGLAQHESALEEMRSMDLWGNVIIWREANQEPETKMTTEFLRFFPQENYIESNALVNFRFGPHTTAGVGMEANLDTQQIKLLNQVQSHYVP